MIKYMNLLHFSKGILNLRGSDISFNPVFKSYLVLSFDRQANTTKGILYINSAKIPQDLNEYLNSNHVEIRPYGQVLSDTTTINIKTAIHKGEINFKVAHSIPSDQLVEMTGIAIINRLKGIKNSTQIEGFKTCNIRDGASLVSYLGWLENELTVNNNTELTEFSAARVLDNKRFMNFLNMGLSFGTISSIGPNAAIVHYSADEATCSKMNPNEIYLVDSGGQYL